MVYVEAVLNCFICYLCQDDRIDLPQDGRDAVPVWSVADLIRRISDEVVYDPEPPSELVLANMLYITKVADDSV